MTRKYNSDELEGIFWGKVHKLDDKSCWEWLGGTDSDGYGAFWFHRRMCGTHRVAWILSYGIIPKGLCVCHECDNPKCCNPNHLWLGTHADNMQDRYAKGRGNKIQGDKNPWRVLSEKDVWDIFEFDRSGIKTRDIAEEFGVSMGTIRKVITRASWRCVNV